MAKMFRVKWGIPHPIEVEAEIPEWPNKDADGNTIYENTHFLKAEDAWPVLLREHEAGVSLHCSQVNQLRHQLRKAESDLVEATLHNEAAIKKQRDWARIKELEGGNG
jgi:hypothetical protein